MVSRHIERFWKEAKLPQRLGVSDKSLNLLKKAVDSRGLLKTQQPKRSQITRCNVRIHRCRSLSARRSGTNQNRLMRFNRFADPP